MGSLQVEKRESQRNSKTKSKMDTWTRTYNENDEVGKTDAWIACPRRRTRIAKAARKALKLNHGMQLP